MSVLPSGLDPTVETNEDLARFARHRDYKPLSLQVRGKLFIPPKGKTVLSVSRVSTLSIAAIRELGEHVVSQAGDTLKGWCLLNVGDIRKIRGLDVVSDEPDHKHFYHAHITGFPLDKSDLLEVADDLAETASLMTVIG